MRRCVLTVVFVVGVSGGVFAHDVSEFCEPPFTSWGAPTLACGVGQTCADLSGYRLEVLHVSGRHAYVRDIDQRFCAFEVAARHDVMYATEKAFKPADCLFPLWRIEVEFGGYPKGCYARSIVLTVKAGVVTVEASSVR